MEKNTNRWILAVEIKRTREAVHSTRYQNQAQTYVTENSTSYDPTRPRYFAITNLERLLLFADRDGQPPRHCRLKDGEFSAGSFAQMTRDEFADALGKCLDSVLDIVLSLEEPQFDVVWPQIIEDLVSFAATHTWAPSSRSGARSPHWHVVRRFFCEDENQERLLVFLLRCLLIDYLRGILEKSGHPRRASLLPVTTETLSHLPNRLAQLFERIRGVDFGQLFEEKAIEDYRTLTRNETKEILQKYVDALLRSDIYRQAKLRLDDRELIDGMLDRMHPDIDLALHGKIRTDLEVANVLATLTVRGPADTILDPCCGDGILLEAAYYRLRRMGRTHQETLDVLSGFECDELLVKLAFLRLVLREPAAINPNTTIALSCENMFDQRSTNAKVILMNPPFMRYEAINVDVPEDLKRHYASAIRSLKHKPSIATTGQQNLFTYYVEYAVSMANHGCRLGIILDNKWYHNEYGMPLRKFLLEHCEIEAIVEYPFQNLFVDRKIATSILICRKSSAVHLGHGTRFIRIRNDLANVRPQDISSALSNDVLPDSTVTSRLALQSELKAEEGWKGFFGNPLTRDYIARLTPLDSFFAFSRRGSLQKEEGGMSPLGFPWSNKTYGRGMNGKPLLVKENALLHELAQRIPSRFKGLAIKNSDTPRNYVLTLDDVTQEPTLEMPWQRGRAEFRVPEKVDMILDSDRTLGTLSSESHVRKFIRRFRKLKGLQDMSRSDLWVGLREPVAGELIIPRKQRKGHRVFVNPFALDPDRRQVRVSSNFICYSGIVPMEGLTPIDATKIIAAFLVSSFGQIQFEILGANREGCLSVEKHHLARVRTLDPRSMSREECKSVIEAFSKLPFPVPTDRRPADLLERSRIDRLIAEVICRLCSWDVEELLLEVHNTLYEYLEARQR
jgi:hypothetical protein